MMIRSTPLAGNHESFLTGNGYWYALLDGAHPTYNTRKLIYEHLPVPEWIALYDDGPYQALVKHGPILLQLTHPTKWLALWQASFPGLPGSLVYSMAPLDVVCNHLRTLISVRVEGGPDALFRFHDSWILSALYPALTDAERLALHGPVERWLWVCGDTVNQGELVAKQEAVQLKEDSWLVLDREGQEAIREGMIAKRNWTEVTQ